MQAQATGADQISQALSQLSEATQQTAESLRQSNISIDQLHDASRGMLTSVPIADCGEDGPERDTHAQVLSRPSSTSSRPLG